MVNLILRWGTLTDNTIPGYSEPCSGNESVLHIPQNSRTEVSSTGGLVSYPGHFLEEEGSYSSAEMQLAYFTVPAN